MTHVFVFLGVLYGIIIIFFYLFQSHFLFFPQPFSSPVDLDQNTEEVKILSSNGNMLHGWLCHDNSNRPQKLIIYFGGNAEEVSHMLPIASMIEDRAMLLVNYPGYGKSEGRPGQESFYRAALAIYDYAAQRDDIDPNNIVLMGRSIGSGPAVYLAHERQVKSVILISPFESIRAVAQSKLPFLPVSLILNHKFPSKKYAVNIDIPLLAFYGTADNIIPPLHSKRLTEYWKGEKKLIGLPSYGHNDIFGSKQLWEEIDSFLGRH
ncbi:MAG: alpha/beta hydrolase [Bacteroidetes bacterium]|nr:MAG: alpha/beta hydrolase [Bacteroidota bacterium]